MSIKKTYFIFLVSISILLLTLLCGCSDSKKPSVSSDTQKTLNMYVNSYDTRTIAAIVEFNYVNKAQIHYETISDDQIQNGEYMKKVTTEIMAGEGPDIILDSSSSFPALNKMVKSKVFCDLNQYINEDKQFKLSDYNTKVLDYGVFNKKRYYMPLNFDINILWASSSLLQRNNISIDESKWTVKDLVNIQKKYIKTQKAQKYLFCFDLGLILQIDDYINITQKEAKFDSKDFIRLLEDCKTIYPSILAGSKLKHPEWEFEYMKNDSLLFGSRGLSPSAIWEFASGANKILNSEIELFLPPGISGKNHPTGFVTEFIAINNSSKYQQEAFEFIKLLLSEKYQNYTYTWFLPVNKKASKALVYKYTGANGIRKDVDNFIPAGESPYDTVPLSDAICKQISTYIENMESCSYIDSNISKLIGEEVYSFLQGKQTSAQTAKIINDRVNIYLNE